MVKYITSKHQIAWGLYGVALPLEILPAPAFPWDLIPLFQLGKKKGRAKPRGCGVGVEQSSRRVPSPCADGRGVWRSLSCGRWEEAANREGNEIGGNWDS